MTRTIVIGGGISGLATAALLAREGHKVTLLEQHAEVGGRAGVWERDGFRFDTGPSWYLMPEVFDHFFRLLGTTAEQQLDLVQLDPGYRVYGEGHAEPLDVSAERRREPRAVRAASSRAPAIRLAKYLDRARETYDLAKQRFLYSTFQRLGPLFGGDVAAQGGRLLQLLLEPLDSLTRRTVRDTRLRQILGYPAVFLGSAPKLAPSMYSLMSHLDLVDGVLYPLGGFTPGHRGDRRPRASRRAPTCSTGTTVHAHRRRTRPARRPASRSPHGKGKKATTLEADVVVSTADLHHTETVLIDRADCAPTRRSTGTSAPPGPGALLIMLGVSGDLPQLEHHTLFFAKDWNKGFEAIFGDQPRIPDTAVALRLQAERGRRRRSRPRAPRTCSCWCRCPPTRRSARAASTARGDAARRGARRPGDRADRRLGRHPRPRRARRAAPHRRARRLRGRPQLVAGQRARPGAHAAAERVLPRGRRQPQGRRPLLRGLVDDPRHRPADVPDQRRAGAQAPARRHLGRRRSPSRCGSRARSA